MRPSKFDLLHQKFDLPDQERYHLPADIPWSSSLAPDRGYEWIDKAATVSNHSAGMGVPPYLAVNKQAIMAERSLRLEDTTALYEVFANLNPTTERILHFANTYGWLGKAEPCVLENHETFMGEPLQRWQYEIKTAAVGRWLLHRVSHKDFATGEDKSAERIAADRRELGRAIRWTADRVIFLANVKGSRLTIESSKEPSTEVRIEIANNQHLRPELFRQWKMAGEGPINPARYVLLDAINLRVRENSPHLYFDHKGDYQGQTVSGSLVGLIWRQMYNTLLGQTKIRQCEICKLWMNVSGSRSTKKMHEQCSKAERMRRYNQRGEKKSSGHQKTRAK